MSASPGAVGPERSVGEHELGRGAEEVRQVRRALVRCAVVPVDPAVTILARTAVAVFPVAVARRAFHVRLARQHGARKVARARAQRGVTPPPVKREGTLLYLEDTLNWHPQLAPRHGARPA